MRTAEIHPSLFLKNIIQATPPKCKEYSKRNPLSYRPSNFG